MVAEDQNNDERLFLSFIQVASRVLEIPIDSIHINETSTDKVPNSAPTAASMGSDLYGEAVLVYTFFI